MGRELTRRHAGIFEQRLHNPFQFVYDVHAYGKLSELISFVVWEAMHRTGLFRREEYVRFADQKVLSLTQERLNKVDFNTRLARFFAENELSIHRTRTNWKLLHSQGDRILGALLPHDRTLYQSKDKGKSVTLLKSFPEPIKSISVSSQNAICVCVKGALYTSWDEGKSFQKTLNMGSAESFFRHNNAMTETPDGTLIIAEYGNVWEGKRWKKLAYLYFSRDNGRSWERSDFLIHKGINKHLHLVKYSKLLDRVFVADGDNKKKLWISTSGKTVDFTKPTGWIPVNRFHIQMGGYTSVVETDECILFGTDYQGGTNFLVSTRDGKTFEKRVLPDPYRRSPIDNMVLRRSKQGTEIWANLPYSTSGTKCLLMRSTDGGRSWQRLIEYDRAAYKVWIVSASSELRDDLYLSIEDVRNHERAVYRVSD